MQRKAMVIGIKPECIEDYMGMQSNYGTGSCELSNCYDVGAVSYTHLTLPTILLV